MIRSSLICLLLSFPGLAAQQSGPLRVVVWDERQPAQKQVYPNFLGNHLADYLRTIKRRNGDPRYDVKSVGLDDPDQGLPKSVLDNCDVLVWWGHQRHGDVKDELAKDIARRVHEGKLSLLALHSAHWSKTFMEVMNLRSIDDALNSLSESERKNVKVTTITPEKRQPGHNEPLTPSFKKTVNADGSVALEVKLPMCVFPDVRGDGKPSHVTTVAPNHPIARGLPATFDIPHTEMYNEPFHVPTPDTVVFEEKWDAGERFRAGCAWNVGKGKVFYFRPGHETFDVFKQPETLKIVDNAVRWLGRKAQ